MLKSRLDIDALYSHARARTPHSEQDADTSHKFRSHKKKPPLPFAATGGEWREISESAVGAAPTVLPQKRKIGQRGANKQPKEARTCKNCQGHGRSDVDEGEDEDEVVIPCPPRRRMTGDDDIADCFSD